ncbi:hypothetical protein HI13_contig00021-0062 [Edwardsiella piscicida]|nr:hypothetical protein HI13_contig00021-0062 [Edwardsiella piscicida]
MLIMENRQTRNKRAKEKSTGINGYDSHRAVADESIVLIFTAALRQLDSFNKYK